MQKRVMCVSWIAACLLGGAVLAACGAPNPSDEALMQSARETRDNLKLPPGERRQEVLWISNGVRMALDQKTLDELRARREAPDPQPASSPEEPDELAAIALAQDATLRLLSGDADEARTMLEASMAQYPTLDALEPLAAMLEAEADDARLVEHCARTREVVDERQVLAVLQVCHRRHSADDLDTTLRWASEADRTRLAVTQGP